MERLIYSQNRIKQSIYKLRKERHLLETHLLNTGRQMAVWLSYRYTYCRQGIAAR